MLGWNWASKVSNGDNKQRGANLKSTLQGVIGTRRKHAQNMKNKLTKRGKTNVVLCIWF